MADEDSIEGDQQYIEDFYDNEDKNKDEKEVDEEGDEQLDMDYS